MLQDTKKGMIERKLEEIKANIYENIIELPQWLTKTGMYSDYGTYSEAEENYESIAVGDHWFCTDHLTRWFKRDVTIPESFLGKKTVLLLEFGGESLVRIDGNIQSALTSYLIPQKATRTRVLIAEVLNNNRTVEVEAETGLNYMEFADFRRRGETRIEYTFRKAQLAAVNREAEAYYFDLITAYESMLALDNPLQCLQHSPLYLSEQITDVEKTLNLRDDYISGQIQEALAASLNCVVFDMSKEELTESVKLAGKVLGDKLSSIAHMPHALIKFVGQGHIDTAWLWTLRETVRKTAKTFSNVVALMDEYPEFIFAFSQPQLFDYMKKYYPGIFQRIKEKAKCGQLELVGNTWVEMDTNIPSGESLVRQILYGKKFFNDEFGKASEVFWMPDVFGYSWALPQIIKKSGMKYFYTCKLNNNKSNHFPYSLFQWQGIDGTRVTSYLQRLNYNGDFCPQTVETIYQRFDGKQYSENLFMTFGYGDGGGGPSYEMLEASRRLKRFPGLQETEIATSQSFFETTDSIQAKLPVWNDEMYFEHHRGTYTSQADIKKANRKNELLYRKTEILSSIAGSRWGMDYPYNQLLTGYHMLLTNQFHDILPGSSIKEVYAQAKKDNLRVAEIAEKELHRSKQIWAKGIRHKKEDIIVFNTLSWDVTGIAEISADGKIIEFEANNVPAMGYKIFSKDEYMEQGQGCMIQDVQHMSNQYFNIEMNDNGNIISIYDKEAEREVLVNDFPSNILKIFEDKPANETAWNMELEYQNHEWPVTDIISAEIIENSDLKGIIRQKRSFHKTELMQDIIIYKNSRRIDFKTWADWQEKEKVLKAEFNVDILSDKAAYEIQFGAIERPTHWNTSYDKAKFEVCGHKWADLSEADYGVSILNDCKYGYDIKDNRMRITLLRASIDPDQEADRGKHEFVYSLYPHLRDWKHGEVVKAGYELNTPLDAMLCTEAAETGIEVKEKSFLRMLQANIIIDTMKRAEDGNGWILRLYESIGKKTNGTMQLGLSLEKAYECNLMEDVEEEYAVVSSSLNFIMKPYEIKTLRLI